MREPQDSRAWRRAMAPRLAILAGFFAAFAVALAVRLVIVQVVHRGFYEVQSNRQVEQMEPLVAPRGDILDRNGKALAMSVEAETIRAEAFRIGNPTRVAAAICEALADCGPGEEATLAKRLGPGKRYVTLRRQVNDAQARRVRALTIKGIYFDKEPHRWYPNRELAAQVLGFVGVDADGLAGLERRYDAILKGRNGRVMLQMGGGRKPFSRVVEAEVPGRTLELTIDANLQYIAERELRAAVAENRAEGGSIVILHPITGELLAMASYPTLNANEFGRASDDEKRNRPVWLNYEPGSTFKIVTATAAIDGRVWSTDDLIDTGDGVIHIPGRAKPIDEAHGKQYGTLSFTDVLVKSSNVGAILIGRRVGSSLLQKYIELFGFGNRLAPDFTGVESAGVYQADRAWSESTLASRAMGYEIAVTALQMAAAASAVANGGELVQPRVVRAVIDGNRRELVPRKVLRRVMTPETAATLTTIMEDIVERGTATRAAVKHFTVAGKTGTSNKNEGGRYIEEYNTSFVGFVPSRKPVMTIVVHIDTPRGPNRPYGGTVAAPVFGRLASAALRYLGVPPSIDPAPAVLVARASAAGSATAPPQAAPVMIVPALAPIAAGQVVLPDLRGMSGREAARVLARIGITPRMTGDGIVVEQEPAPGTPVDFGAACRLGAGARHPGGPAVTLADLLGALGDLAPDARSAPEGAAAERVVKAVVYDSRKAGASSVFVALKGQKADGSAFATQALSRGAMLVVAETPAPAGVHAAWVMVPDARLALSRLAARFYRHPSRELQVVAITGTNGKTTIAYLASALFDAAGLRCGMLGTIVYRIGGEEREATRTTPESADVQQMLREMVSRECKACAMEVSSHALAQRRVDDVRFAVGVFSNLTRDHLDYHGDMESYFRAKRRLFELVGPEGTAVVNLDDPRGASLAGIAGRTLTYAIDRPADIRPSKLSHSLRGFAFEAATPAGPVQVRSRLVGRANVSNVLAAIGAAIGGGLPVDAIERGLAGLEAVPGRFQVVSDAEDDITVVVDYAHTDDALKNLLETARPLASRRLITVFGAGGDRDKTKRPLMGAVAARLSDLVVVTSDNPRTEDPGRIIEEITRGIALPAERARPSEPREGQPKYTPPKATAHLAIVDRKLAIERAIDLARPDDVVLLAGKGHEKYQVIGEREVPFDDVAVARQALAKRRAGRG